MVHQRAGAEYNLLIIDLHYPAIPSSRASLFPTGVSRVRTSAETVAVRCGSLLVLGFFHDGYLMLHLLGRQSFEVAGYHSLPRTPHPLTANASPSYSTSFILGHPNFENCMCVKNGVPQAMGFALTCFSGPTQRLVGQKQRH